VLTVNKFWSALLRSKTAFGEGSFRKRRRNSNTQFKEIFEEFKMMKKMIYLLWFVNDVLLKK